MTGKTHQIIGLSTGIVTYLSVADLHYAPASFAAVIVLSHLLSLLPDLDQPLSEFWQSIPVGRYLGRVAGLFFEHRNLTHSFLGCFLVWEGLSYLGGLVPTYWGIDVPAVQLAALMAYISHLIADMVTVQGIPLLFPRQRMFGFPPKPFQGIRIVTGKWFENFIVFPAVNLLLIVIIYLSWPAIKIVLFR